MLDFYYNDAAKLNLTRLLRGGRFPHALLLEGADGSGKTHFARLAAAALLCERPQSPCGTCAACTKVLKNIHPDVEIYSDEGGARSFHIDSVRSIKSGAYLIPSEAQKKIYILRNAHNMTVQAQNALLKMIEEPPCHAVFILTAKHRAALLPTVASRVVSIRLEVPDIPGCEKALISLSPGRERAVYAKAAKTAGGNIGVALSLLEDPARLQIYDDAEKILSELYARNEFAMASAFAKYERNRQDFLLLLEILRNMTAGAAAGNSAGRPESNTITSPDIRTAFKAAAVLDAAYEYALQNVNLPLLAAYISAELFISADRRL